MNEPTPTPITPVDAETSSAENALVSQLGEGGWKKYVRFVIAALGSIPWVGGVIGASASLSAERGQDRLNELQRLWLEEHRKKTEDLKAALSEILLRLDRFGEEIKERITSDEYLALVRQMFRSWDKAETVEKREMLKRLITNAGATTLCSDDLVRLFIGWIDLYHEAHFAVIAEVFKNPGITRREIWDRIHPGGKPPENSADADLFRYLIRELSTGGVVRQERETDGEGNFLRNRAHRSPRGTNSRSDYMESTFEDTKGYVLTELGKEFVHYVMSDVVPRIQAPSPPDSR